MSRSTPFHRALIEPRFTLGMDRSLLGLLTIVSMGMVMALRSFWPITAGIVVAVVLRSIFAKDPNYLRAYGSYCRETDHYEAWPTCGVRSGRRPGHGRGVLC